MSPVGAIFVPFSPKTRTNLLHPRPPPIVERVRTNFQYHRKGLMDLYYFSTGQIVSSRKCTSTSPEAGRLRTKLVTGSVSDKAPCTEMRSSNSQ